MPGYGYVILAAGWIFWFLPYPLQGWDSSTPQKRDNRARWGLLLQVVSYVLLFEGHFRTASPASWRIALSVVLLMLAVLLSWTSVHALGKHLRFDAVLSRDHQLVQSGAYRVVRHPIYSSMLCLLLGTGFMISSTLCFIPAILIFLAGTEIRVRVEDKLLAAYFGDQFRRYQQAISAYIPFVR